MRTPILVNGAFATNNAAKGMVQIGSDMLFLATGSSTWPVVGRVTAAGTMSFIHQLPYPVPAGFTLTSGAPAALVASADRNYRVSSTVQMAYQGIPSYHFARISTLSASGAGVQELVLCDTENANGCSGSCIASTDAGPMADSIGNNGTIVAFRSAFSSSGFVVAFVQYDGVVRWAQRVSFPVDGMAAAPTSAVSFTNGNVGFVGFATEGSVVGYDAFYLVFTPDGKAALGGQYGYVLGRASAAGAATNELALGAGRGTSNRLLLAGAVTDTGSAARSLDAWLVVIASDGSIESQTEYGGDGSDLAYGVAAAANTGYFLAGATANSFGGSDNDIWALRTDDPTAFVFNSTSGGHVRATGAKPRSSANVSATTCIYTGTGTLSPTGAESGVTIVDPIFRRQAP